jgi:uncharacterized Ntn-hydrolase superfamily protein
MENKSDTNKNYLENLMSLIDDNSDKINEGMYLQTCNLLKKIFETNKISANENTNLNKEKDLLQIEKHILEKSITDLRLTIKSKNEGEFEFENMWQNQVNGLSYSGINFSSSLIDH